jgi:hypothetical protein
LHRQDDDNDASVELEHEGGQRRKEDSRVNHMYTDMYIGRGKFNPSITQRIATLEDHMEAVKNTIKRVERIEWGILLTLLGLLITVVTHH